MNLRACTAQFLQKIPSRYNLRMIAGGVVSYLPNQKGVGLRGTVLQHNKLPASYYYSVYLRHLVKLYESGANSHPKTVAEIGPGDALGAGLAALLSGADHYFAFDVIKTAEKAENLKVFAEMVQLFQNRAPIPDPSIYPYVEPFLKSYEFPKHILTDQRLTSALHESRLEWIRKAIQGELTSGADPITVSYVVPWNDASLLQPESIDLIFSQAVLEHVDGLEDVYRAMSQWLKRGGAMSHSIDFRSHGVSPYWNGHWAYSKILWKIMRGRRPFLLNREPYSRHLNLIKKAGLEMICSEPLEDSAGLERRYLAREFRIHLTEDDFKTRTVFLQAQKPIA